MLFAEAVDNNKSLNLTICRSKETRLCRVHVYRDAIEVHNGIRSNRVKLNGVNISFMSCRNLCSSGEDSISVSFDASFDLVCQNNNDFYKMENNICVAETIICGFCEQKLGNIKDIKCDTNLQKPILLGEDGLSIEGGFFCHQNKDNAPTLTETSVDAQTLLFEHDLNSSLNCRSTGLEMVLDCSFVEQNSFSVKKNNYVHCSYCQMAFGKKVSCGLREYVVFWTNRVNVLIREKSDTDDNFFRLVKQPLIFDDSKFYGLLITNLVESNHYRIILSAITWDGLIDFMLIWLPDQRINLYTTSLEECKSSTTDNRKKPLKEDGNNVSSSIHCINVEPNACRRVFYRLVFPDNCSSDKSRLLDSWRKDFGVTLIHLPMETCIGFSECLRQSSLQVAPHTRELNGPMAGFISGAVPLINAGK
ncbi:unnamed protein product [Trichobilharzia szidati]|nr:unnamed protein product [Trichobilharzia szidati]CAH8857341.1 unnamed protein product [Trichobilharzia szidati]